MHTIRMIAAGTTLAACYAVTAIVGTVVLVVMGMIATTLAISGTIRAS